MTGETKSPNFIPPGVWMSVYDLADAMSRTYKWVRRNVRDAGGVPHAKVGDTDYFFTDDVIAWLESLKVDPRADRGQ